MSRIRSCLVTLAVVALLVVASVATWTWLTIPDAPDPASLPSQVLEAPSPRFSAAVEEGRAVARELTAEEKLPGLSLAVAVEGEIVWAEGLRFADLENETPMTPDQRFRIGGISQCLTAAAVARLVEAGQLDLDAPVQEYVPDFPGKPWPITTRQLMSHTAGIRHHRGEGGIFRGGPCEDDDARLARFADAPLQVEPGTELVYSNHGWTLVGSVVAGAAGEPFLDFLRREVLTPLGMVDTGPDVTGESAAADATMYYPRLALNPSLGLQPVPAVELSCYLPAIGFWSTPSDLVRFGAAHLAGAVLDSAVVRELHTPVELASGRSTKQALGWKVEVRQLGASKTPTAVVAQGLGEVVQRSPLSAGTVPGQVAGGTTALLLVPEFGVVVAVASNVSGAQNVPRLAERLADLFVRAMESGVSD